MADISLQMVANQLSRWEVPILQALRHRCASQSAEDGAEKLWSALAADEAELAEAERSEVAYRPFCQPWGEGLSAADPLLWSAAGVNVNAALWQRYQELRPRLPRLTGASEDCDWQAERALLPRMSYRIHYGAVYVAECKFCDDEQGWRRLVSADDRAEMMRRLTRTEVEEQLLRRVALLGLRLAGEALSVAGEVLYRQLMIPLTKEGEVAYLLRRARC